MKKYQSKSTSDKPEQKDVDFIEKRPKRYESQHEFKRTLFSSTPTESSTVPISDEEENIMLLMRIQEESNLKVQISAELYTFSKEAVKEFDQMFMERQVKSKKEET